ncbi:hypothetical protein MP228_000051 [Amoeboaphelidium protococcarum]|nr:hypothetical protein MP228_000051 [Amoeboaphelidium protococcarum]
MKLWTNSEFENHLQNGSQDIDASSLRRKIVLYNHAKASLFMLQVGLKLRVPTYTYSTACYILHQFYVHLSLQRLDRNDRSSKNSQSEDIFKMYHIYEIGAAALFIACKLEESIRRAEDFVTAVCRVALKNEHFRIQPGDVQSQNEFRKWMEVLLRVEDVIVADVLGVSFCEFGMMRGELNVPLTEKMSLNVDTSDSSGIYRVTFQKKVNGHDSSGMGYPHGYIEFLVERVSNAGLLQQLDEHVGWHYQLQKTTWTFVSDFLRTPVICRFQPYVIACTALILAQSRLVTQIVHMSSQIIAPTDGADTGELAIPIEESAVSLIKAFGLHLAQQWCKVLNITYDDYEEGVKILKEVYSNADIRSTLEGVFQSHLAGSQMFNILKTIKIQLPSPYIEEEGEVE